MDHLLTLLKEAASEEAIARENHTAMNAMGDDVIAAIEQRSAHREFSMYTPPEGRP